MTRLDGLRILAWVHKYPPLHNAGAEWMLHELLADSVQRGAKAIVVPVWSGRSQTLDGVQIVERRTVSAVGLFTAAHVVVTHLDVTREACGYARQFGDRPVVHLVHNDRQLTFHRVTTRDVAAAVANSRWIAETIPAKFGDPVVVHPPVDLARWAPIDGPHDRVVLVNATIPKGVDTFYALAERWPSVRFLLVKGAYGQQVIRDLPNVEVVDNTPNMREDVYARARVVLVPSVYESWGRVAIEASAGGIPVIYAPTPGLVEAMGDAGIEAAWGDLDAWSGCLKPLLHDRDYYADRSRAGVARAAQLDPKREGGDFDTWAETLTRVSARARVGERRSVRR